MNDQQPLQTDFEGDLVGNADNANADDDQKAGDQEVGDQKLAEPKTQSTRAPKDNDGVPYCVDHHCRMKQTSGGSGSASYYTCPAKGCKNTGKKIKLGHPNVVPRQPIICKRCSEKKMKAGKVCRNNKTNEILYNKPVYFEMVKRLSTPQTVILKCPQCQASSGTLPTPLYADSHLRHLQDQKERKKKLDQSREKREDIGRR